MNAKLNPMRVPVMFCSAGLLLTVSCPPTTNGEFELAKHKSALTAGYVLEAGDESDAEIGEGNACSHRARDRVEQWHCRQVRTVDNL